jgi:alcohol dehydrogenase (cytochrome c)
VDPMTWMHYGKDYESTRYHQAAQITPSHAADLVAKWSLSGGVLEGAAVLSQIM